MLRSYWPRTHTSILGVCRFFLGGIRPECFQMTSASQKVTSKHAHLSYALSVYWPYVSLTSEQGQATLRIVILYVFIKYINTW